RPRRAGRAGALVAADRRRGPLAPQRTPGARGRHAAGAGADLMFTGIVTAVGKVREARAEAGGVALAIEAPYPDLEVGESVAVDGACLTVNQVGAGWFAVHVVVTSVARTRVGRYAAGRRVNLERALRVGDRLGGHLVHGHVDGVGVIERVADRDD